MPVIHSGTGSYEVKVAQGDPAATHAAAQVRNSFPHNRVHRVPLDKYSRDTPPRLGSFSQEGSHPSGYQYGIDRPRSGK